MSASPRTLLTRAQYKVVADLLPKLADPKHEQREEMLQWRKPFDAEKLDSNKTTKAMRRGLPDWRQFT